MDKVKVMRSRRFPKRGGIFICLLSLINLSLGNRLSGGEGPDRSWVVIPNQGRWQRFELPARWIEKHGKSKHLRGAAIELVPPDPADSFDSTLAPYSAPSRIALVTLTDDNRVRTVQLSCIETGNEDETLWGYNTLLEGLTLSILKDDSVQITKVFRKGGFSAPEDLTDAKKVAPIKYESERRYKLMVLLASVLLGSDKPLGSCTGDE